MQIKMPTTYVFINALFNSINRDRVYSEGEKRAEVAADY